MKKTSLLLIAFLWLVQLHAQQVHAVSAMRKVMMGEDLSAHLFWDTIPHQNLYGISPSGRIDGEITIIDGQFYNTRVDSEGRILMLQEWKTKAPFGVYAHVQRWDTLALQEMVNSEAGLQEVLEKKALERNYDLNEAFPFRIIGSFDTIWFHIISKPPQEMEHNHELHDRAKKHFTLTNTEGELLGFYSQNHIGVFTHRGTYTHVHFIDAARKKMGHLERISFQQPVLLLLTSKSLVRTASVRSLATKAFKKTLRKTKNAVLLDVRTPDEFAEGHLKNAQNIDYLADEFETQVSRLDKSKPYFLYCRSGKRTAGAAELMLALGFEKIYTLDGGILAWEEQKMPVVRPATHH